MRQAKPLISRVIACWKTGHLLVANATNKVQYVFAICSKPSLRNNKAPQSINIDNPYTDTVAMAGSIDYVSFPRFTPKRRLLPPGILTISLALTRAFVSLRGILSHRQLRGNNCAMSPPTEASPGRLRSWLTSCKRTAVERIDMTSKERKKANTNGINCCRLNVSSVDRSSEANKPADCHNLSPTSFRTRVTRQLWPPNRCVLGNSTTATSPLGSIAMTSKVEPTDEALIADLDALCLSTLEHETLKRVEQICHTATVAQERRLKTRPMLQSHDPDSNRRNIANFTYLHLRGGGDDDGALPPPFRGPSPRTTLPFIPPATPLPDSYRPSAGLWWLAGGKRSRNGRVPTLRELRVRKEVERASRGIVGFWGTVLGLRRVGRVGVFGKENDAGGDDESDGEGSVTGGGGDGGGETPKGGDGFIHAGAAENARTISVANSTRSGAVSEGRSVKSGRKASEKGDEGGEEVDAADAASVLGSGERPKSERR